MAKETGLGWTAFSVDDSGGTVRDCRNSVTSLKFATPRGVQDVTGLDKNANERLLLLADFSVDVDGVFDDGTTGIFTIFKTVSSTSVARTVTITVSANTLACETLFTDMQVERSDSGELTIKAPGVLADGTVPTWT